LASVYRSSLLVEIVSEFHQLKVFSSNAEKIGSNQVEFSGFIRPVHLTSMGDPAETNPMWQCVMLLGSEAGGRGVTNTASYKLNVPFTLHSNAGKEEKLYSFCNCQLSNDLLSLI